MSLCPACQHVREISTPKGSRFWMCLRAQREPQFPKYPPQPVPTCRGYEPRQTHTRPPSLVRPEGDAAAH